MEAAVQHSRGYARQKAVIHPGVSLPGQGLAVNLPHYASQRTLTAMRTAIEMGSGLHKHDTTDSGRTQSPLVLIPGSLSQTNVLFEVRSLPLDSVKVVNTIVPLVEFDMCDPALVNAGDNRQSPCDLGPLILRGLVL